MRNILEDLNYNCLHSNNKSLPTVVKEREGLNLPLLITLDDGRKLRCERMLRIVPARRAAFLGTLESQSVFVKLFLKRHQAKRHVRREVQGYLLLKELAIPTPKLICAYEALEGGLGLVIFEYLSGCKSLKTIIEKAESGEESLALLAECVRVMARMHEGGIVGLDPHFDNFLVRKDEIYVADCASIARKHVGQKIFFKNLALFLAQLSVSKRELLVPLTKIYLAERSLPCNESSITPQLKNIERYQNIRLRKLYKKVFRESTRIAMSRSFWNRVLYDREWFGQGADPLTMVEREIQHKDCTLLKGGRTSTLFLINLGRKPVVVKRYNTKGVLHVIRKAISPSRASKSWALAHVLEMIGIPTPKPIAMIEKRLGPFRGISYYVYEYVEGIEAQKFFMGGIAEEQILMATKLAELFKALASYCISHGDTKATNYIIAPCGPYILDLDGMKIHRHRFLFKKRFKRNVERFMANWEGIEDTLELFRRLLKDLDERLGDKS